MLSKPQQLGQSAVHSQFEYMSFRKPILYACGKKKCQQNCEWENACQLSAKIGHENILKKQQHWEECVRMWERKRDEQTEIIWKSNWNLPLGAYVGSFITSTGTPENRATVWKTWKTHFDQLLLYTGSWGLFEVWLVMTSHMNVCHCAAYIPHGWMEDILVITIIKWWSQCCIWFEGSIVEKACSLCNKTEFILQIYL